MLTRFVTALDSGYEQHYMLTEPLLIASNSLLSFTLIGVVEISKSAAPRSHGAYDAATM